MPNITVAVLMKIVLWKAIFRGDYKGSSLFSCIFLQEKAEKMHKWDFRNTYYLIIYRVREWEMWSVWDLKTPVGVRRDPILGSPAKVGGML